MNNNKIVRTVLSVIIMLSLSVAVVNVATKNGTIKAQNAIKFKNRQIEKEIREQIKKPKGNLTTADLCKVNKLDLLCNGLEDISDLRYLPNLTKLNLGRNDLYDITA